MLKYRRVIQSSARRIAAAATRTLVDYADGRIEHEPEFTGKMLGRMEESMNDYQIKHVRWTAKILTSHGPKSQEKLFGADFIGVVNFNFPDYKVDKGFLAQAKRIEIGERLNGDERGRLLHQCSQMLEITTDAFVFLYASTGITIVPALAVIAAADGGDLHELYSRTVARFYADHFECFIGDRRIHSADIATLERLRVRYALALGATSTEPLLDDLRRVHHRL
jgi:hypothetical protein